MPDPGRSLVVIPARGGSKRLPRKNLLDLAGKPLIAHTIEAAVQSGCFGQILVSSDDAEIRSIAETYPGVEADNRAAELGGDRVKVVEVIAEICQRPSVQENFDMIGMMLPTAPFRLLADIRAGHAALTEDVDGVISVAPYDFPPQMAVTLSEEDGVMAPLFEESPLLTGNTRSQDQAAAYRPNGSYYLSWVESFLRRRSFFTGRVRGVAMTRLGSVDIDEAEDLALARLLAEGGLAPSDTLTKQTNR